MKIREPRVRWPSRPTTTHLRHCVVKAAADGNPDAKIKEATTAIARLVRS
jgi:hypothetical protein